METAAVLLKSMGSNDTDHFEVNIHHHLKGAFKGCDSILCDGKIAMDLSGSRSKDLRRQAHLLECDQMFTYR